MSFSKQNSMDTPCILILMEAHYRYNNQNNLITSLYFCKVVIHLNHLESELNEKTRLRGYDFYCEGRVKSVFNINGIEWMAIVQGYDDHVVQLKRHNDSITYWECNCNDTEDPCKHVAAVLFYIKKEGNKLVKLDTTGYEEIKEHLSYLPPHVLRYLILKYAAENSQFRKFLNGFFNIEKK